MDTKKAFERCSKEILEWLSLGKWLKGPLVRWDFVFYLCEKPVSEKNQTDLQSVAPEKICQPATTQQVGAEPKWFLCCLIGQLAKANAVKYVQEAAEGDH